MKNDAFLKAHQKTGLEISRAVLRRFRKHHMFEYAATPDRSDPLMQILDVFVQHFESSWNSLWDILDLGEYDSQDSKSGSSESCKNVSGLAEYMRDNTAVAVLSHETARQSHQYYTLALVGRDAPLTPLSPDHQCAFPDTESDATVQQSVRAVADIAESVKHHICDLLFSSAQDFYASLHKKPQKAGNKADRKRDGTKDNGKPSLKLVR